MAKVFPDGWCELTAMGSADALHARLRKACGEQATYLDSQLYCPGYKVKQPPTVDALCQ